ncbi:MAG: hypothetical protein GEU78_19700, partial [Actinobacteria bacterium]|nr:hypothetical protein [Actinomycetota bacterium]
MCVKHGFDRQEQLTSQGPVVEVENQVLSQYPRDLVPSWDDLPHGAFTDPSLDRDVPIEIVEYGYLHRESNGILAGKGGSMHLTSVE